MEFLRSGSDSNLCFGSGVQLTMSHTSHTKTKRENHLSDRDSPEANQATHSKNHLTHQWILLAADLAALSPPRASLPLMPTTGKSFRVLFRVHTSSFPPFKLLFAACMFLQHRSQLPKSLLDYITVSTSFSTCSGRPPFIFQGMQDIRTSD